jgi:amino acid adenylation domain-containing protein
MTVSPPDNDPGLERSSAGQAAIATIERLAPIQFGILYGCLKDKTKTVYLGQWRGTLDGCLDAVRLGRSWQALVKRHAILRTAFDWQLKAEPLQIVLRDVAASVDVIDISALSSSAAREERLAAFLAEDLARGFDLDRPPLMRLTLLRLGLERHVLVWTRHHLTCDGWSLAEMFGELFAIYQALGEHRAPVLPRAIAFTEYVKWWHAADRVAAETYWRGRFSGLDDEVPRRDPTIGEGDGFQHQLQVIAADRLDRLRAACRAQRITLNTLVQGAWALVLARHRGRDRVVFGATESVRPDQSDVGGLCVGPQINTLPVIVETWTETPVEAWLRDLQAAAVAGRRHGRISLPEIAACCGAGRGQVPFDSVLVFQNYPLQAAALPPALGLSLSGVEDVSIPDLPITLIVEPGEQLVCRLIHDTAAVTAAAARQLLAHLVMGLFALAEAPAAAVSTMDVAPELRPSPVALGPHPAEAGETVLHRIAAAAEDAVALVQGETEVTYGALGRRAEALAAALCRRLGPGRRIGLLCRPSIDSIIGLLAIQWAGGAYVPLDPAMPGPRLAAMVADAELAAMLVDPAADAGRLRDVVAGLPILDYAEMIAAAVPQAPLMLPAPEALAYIIFTSGSTGRPKGVAVSHRSLLAILDARTDVFPEPVGGALLTFPLIFDGSVMILFATLARGARLVLPELAPQPAPSLDPAALCRTIARARVTHTVMVPSLHAALLDAAAPGELDGLVACAVAGEACDADLVRRHYAALPNTVLVNEYGPTEATVWASAYRCRPDDAGASAPIGFPIRGTAIYLLDAHQRPVLPGTPGEIVIGGRGVAVGYVGNGSLTAERFLPDPWCRDPSSGEAGGRMYRTGDLAVVRADGALLFLGRNDQQIKLRGYRIEPGEIEAALRAEPGVAEAVVLARGSAERAERLVGYVVGRAGEAAPEPRALQRAVAAKLPAYMVPIVMVLPALPRLPSGKLDRAALPGPADDVGCETGAESGSAPAPGEEAALAAVWCAVLRREVVSATADFFDLGGTSLLGMRLVAQIRAGLGAPIALYDLFCYPTIRSLAPIVAGARAPATVAPAAIPRRERQRVSAPSRSGA